MEAVLKTLLAYFVIVDPVGTAVIFNSLTQGKSNAYCRTMAVRAVLLSTTLIFIFGFFGMGLLSSLGIEMESFRIAGGLLIFYTAFGMITRPDNAKQGVRESDHEDISVFPLSIPLIAGPGSLTLSVLLFSQAAERGESYHPLIIAVLIIYTATLIIFLLARRLARLMGSTVNNIFKRLLGVLLASLAIQFVADGVKGLFGLMGA